jgi:hypothetical protein
MGIGYNAEILTEDILLSNQGKVNAYLGSETQAIDDIISILAICYFLAKGEFIQKWLHSL